MSDNVQVIEAALTRESAEALAAWWGWQAVGFLRQGNEERAEHAASTAAHFARRVETVGENHG